MAGAAAGLFAVFLLVGVGGALLLYLFVREEGNWDSMARGDAEETARRDGRERR